MFSFCSDVSIGGRIPSSRGYNETIPRGQIVHSHYNEHGISVPKIISPPGQREPQYWGEEWDVSPPKGCKCKDPKPVVVVGTVYCDRKNYGRFFYRCPLYQHKSLDCGYLEFVDHWEKLMRERFQDSGEAVIQAPGGNFYREPQIENPRASVPGNYNDNYRHFRSSRSFNGGGPGYRGSFF